MNTTLTLKQRFGYWLFNFSGKIEGIAHNLHDLGLRLYLAKNANSSEAAK